VGTVQPSEGLTESFLRHPASLRGTEASIVGGLSLREYSHIASLTIIIHHSLPTDGAKSVLGLSGFAEDDVGRKWAYKRARVERLIFFLQR